MNDKPASLPQLVALRDALLAWKDKDAAAAVDNLIDLLSDPRTPSQVEDDERDADWQAQISELRDITK